MDNQCAGCGRTFHDTVAWPAGARCLDCTHGVNIHASLGFRKDQPNLGLATTDQLLHELEVRFEVSGRLAAHDAVAWVRKTALDSEALAYRTVDHA